MRKKWNWAILGCGKIAEKFSLDLKLLSNARLYATASRSLEKAQNFANEYGYVKAFGSYKEMLSDPEVDIVYIATPHSFHRDHTILCLNNKKAVLCEKAFALNSTQVSDMVKSSKVNNTFLMEAFWTRFQPFFLELTKILKSGRLGNCKMMRSDFAFNGPYDPENRLYNLDLGGGSLLDIGIYPVFWALQSFGTPEKISATADFCHTGSEESIAITFQYPDGRIASLMSSFAVYTDTKTEFWCEKGFIQIKRDGTSSTILQIKESDGTEETLNFTNDKAFGYHLEAAHVMDCLDAGKIESDLLPLSFSLTLIETLDKIREAAGIVYPADS
ncbi:Gfo/Idh/MocA family protein [Bacteroidota bacterium]